MRYCEKKGKKSSFDKRSFRRIQSGKAMLIVACPKGSWSPKKERCKAGMRAYSVLVANPRKKRCPTGWRKVVK